MSDPDLRTFVETLRCAALSERDLAAVRQAVLVETGAAAAATSAAASTKPLGSLLPASLESLAVIGLVALAPLLPPEHATPGAATPPVVVGAHTPREPAEAQYPPHYVRLAQARPPAPREPDVANGTVPSAPAPDVSKGTVPFETLAEVPASEELADGVRHYARGEHAEAAAALLPVVEGRTDDSRASLHHAQFALAKSLVHLRLFHSAAIVFDAITREGDAHPHFEESLPWLAQLARHLPEPTSLIELVGRYRREQLSRLGTQLSGDHYDELLYLLGRDRYARRDLSGAVALFREVRPGSDRYVDARFFEGVSHVRMRRARPAVAAFRAVVAAIEEGRAGDREDADRMRDLAWLSLARVYYSAAHQGDDRRLLGNAIDAWNRIPESSEHWLDAIFEQAWALFVAGEHERSLGGIHALLSPYFEDRHYPEAWVLRAVVLFQHCQLDASEEVVAEFHRRYDPLLRELRAALAAHGEHAQAFALLESVRAGRASLPPRAATVIRSAFDDRELLRHLGQVRSIAGEERRVRALADPSLAAWLGQELAVAKAMAVDRTGELARLRLERRVEELQEQMNQMDAVQLEIHTERRRRPEGYAAADSEITVVADQEHVVWPFDGEYWEDELPYYRVYVPDRCTR